MPTTPPAMDVVQLPICSGVSRSRSVIVAGSSCSWVCEFTQLTDCSTVVGSDVTSCASCWKKRLPNRAPRASRNTTTKLPTTPVAVPRRMPRAVRRRMAGSIAIAKSQDSMRMKRKCPIAAKTPSARSHSVTITSTLMTERRSDRGSNATSVTGRASPPGGVCAPGRRWVRRGTATVTGSGAPDAGSCGGPIKASPGAGVPAAGRWVGFSLTLPPRCAPLRP